MLRFSVSPIRRFILLFPTDHVSYLFTGHLVTDHWSLLSHLTTDPGLPTTSFLPPLFTLAIVGNKLHGLLDVFQGHVRFNWAVSDQSA